jgi:hypothetical protein
MTDGLVFVAFVRQSQDYIIFPYLLNQKPSAILIR